MSSRTINSSLKHTGTHPTNLMDNITGTLYCTRHYTHFSLHTLWLSSVQTWQLWASHSFLNPVGIQCHETYQQSIEGPCKTAFPLQRWYSTVLRELCWLTSKIPSINSTVRVWNFVLAHWHCNNIKFIPLVYTITSSIKIEHGVCVVVVYLLH